MNPYVEKIRKLYPAPSSTWGRDTARDGDGCYCVLGAACMFKGISYAIFPTAGLASEILGIPYDVCKQIINLNSDGAFRDAWNLLSEHLHEPKELS